MLSMRLDKYLAESAAGTRKVVRDYVKDGKVTVNDQVILNPAEEIDEKADTVICLGRETIHTGKVYYMFHKPAGCVTARTDEDCRTVLDYFDPDHRAGIFPVGRLDKDTEGLLLLTNDGEFSHNLMHPDKHIEKTYFFWAFGRLNEDSKAKLLSGISLKSEEDLAIAYKLEVVEEGNYQDLRERIEPLIRRDIRMNSSRQAVVAGYLTISEGRKHQVKRMLKEVGCYIAYLKRVSIGELYLDEALPKGQYRELTKEEIELVRHLN
ncbi:MAG: pseudouridine synthase family protein [Firmicutes bacterium]|nr:pseudouridine synthase family protein [Bacillota bacterium]